ncbi:uncharacterized protein BT62DRAFT_98834 [Guyanagaster necrorhizus]|uniref:C2H2-type domain-containing protein n=1 Tax=Guyanagaster necrorhizus TaxID=856835 RepID=A0A9P7VUC8_9AGAR|nr:uncharacterized protein BT62DRAFT_98834 [Guyanagaster necrorhizus MCA 3950]KAG7447032.1 hypothetical protein BT62DRAFT_98834 [Guyanagaster necrorhizus MCA 3950]
MLVSWQAMSKTWIKHMPHERYKMSALSSLVPHSQNTLNPNNSHHLTKQLLLPIIISTDMIFMDGTYCLLCEKYFFDKQEEAELIMKSNAHFKCGGCRGRFLNCRILRRPCAVVLNHHYCVQCNKHCGTAEGFRVHMEQFHRFDDDDNDDDPWEGVDTDDSNDESWERVEHNDSADDSWEEVGDYDDLDGGRVDERAEDEVSEPGNEPLDTSWEDTEDDFFGPERLRLPLPTLSWFFIPSSLGLTRPIQNDGAADDAEGSDEEDLEERSHSSWLMDQQEHTVRGAAPCRHVYSVICIRAALKFTEACPVYEGRVTKVQLRKMYICPA